MLRVLFTADWRLDRAFSRFGADAQNRLTQARLTTIESLLTLAEEESVHSVWCAGDVFASPFPSSTSRDALLGALKKFDWKDRALWLVPGARDAAVDGSVWLDARFRASLPAWVKVVASQREVMQLDDSLAATFVPVRSRSGGVTQGIDAGVGVMSATTPPVEASGRWFLGTSGTVRHVGDHVFAGSPEAMDFGDVPRVALVSFHEKKLVVEPRDVSTLDWLTLTVTSLEALEQVLARKDLAELVLRLMVDARVPASQALEWESRLTELESRDDVIVELETSQLRIEGPSPDERAWPSTFRRTAELLAAQLDAPETRSGASRALGLLAAHASAPVAALKKGRKR